MYSPHGLTRLVSVLAATPERSEIKLVTTYAGGVAVATEATTRIAVDARSERALLLASVILVFMFVYSDMWLFHRTNPDDSGFRISGAAVDGQTDLAAMQGI